MILSEIIEQLQVGEFAQISFGGKAGVIEGDTVKTMVLHINLGLANLYKRFNIKKGRVVIRLDPEISTYAITSANSVTREGVSKKFVMDSLQARFKDDINKIEKIFWEHDNTEVPINDASCPTTIFTSTLNTLEMPRDFLKPMVGVLLDERKNNRLVLDYRAGYFPSFKITDIAIPEVTKFDFPDMYLEALLYFVASRVHNPIGMSQEFHQGNNYAAKYEAECQRLEQLGMQMNHVQEGSLFRRKGWV